MFNNIEDRVAPEKLIFRMGLPQSLSFGALRRCHLKDLTGKKFGKWTVLERTINGGNRGAHWSCLCECGTVRVVRGSRLSYGDSKSCGCYCHSEEYSKIKSEFFKNLPRSEEHKARIGAAHKGRKFSEEHLRKLSLSRKGRKPSMEAREAMSKAHLGSKRSDETKRKMSIAQTNAAPRSKNWKGGITKLDLPLYDTYAEQLYPIEEVRRNPEDERLLQVKCTYCGAWIQPTLSQVIGRAKFLRGTGRAETRIYCKGNSCRSQCPIFGQKTWPKEYAPSTSREVQPELRKMVFERDNYQCQKCGAKGLIHCHHIEPVAVNPIESADIDNCVTLCKSCHASMHHIHGCRNQDLKCA